MPGCETAILCFLSALAPGFLSAVQLRCRRVINGILLMLNFALAIIPKATNIEFADNFAAVGACSILFHK